MFKPYEFSALGNGSSLDGLSAGRLPLTFVTEADGLDFGPELGGGFGEGFGRVAFNPAIMEAAVMAVLEGSIATVLAQAAVNAMIDDGHSHTFDFQGDSDGCGCGHSHDEHLQMKNMAIEFAAQLQDLIDSGSVEMSFAGLMDAVSLVTGLDPEDVSGAYDAVIDAYGKAVVPLANEPADGDLPADTTTTGTLEVGGRVTGNRADGDDEDWFAIELVEGQEYVFIMLRSGENPHTDPLVNLYNAAGELIDTNDDADVDGDGFGENRNSMFFFTAESSGTYYLGASGYDNATGTFEGTGDYTLFAETSDDRPDFTIEEAAFFLTDQFDNQERWDQDVITYDVSALNDGAQTLAINAMAEWASVSGIRLEAVAEGAGPADLVFSEENAAGDGQQAFSQSTSSNGIISSSRIVISENWDLQQDGTPDYGLNSYRYQTYLHEIGHSLGLGHGGPYNGVSSNSDTGDRYNVFNQDAWNYTVMSYFDQGEAGTGTPRLVLGLQTVDIFAIQDLYGTNDATRAGDSTYGFNSTETGIYDLDGNFASQGIRAPSFAIYDAGGIDTLDFSGYGADQFISLVEGSFSSVSDNTNTPIASDAVSNNISIALGTVIENAIGGSGNDVFVGNAANNTFTGNAGNDRFDGGAGTDTVVLTAQQGDYTVSTETIAGVEYLVLTNGLEGTDRINLDDIEFVAFNNGTQRVATRSLVGPQIVFTNGADSVVGTDADDVFNALAGDDTVDGAGGNDVIDGSLGADDLLGSAGNDLLIGDIAYALGGIEGQVYRAYQAVFDRDPDLNGFNAITTELLLGNQTLIQIFDAFVDSPEFLATYGADLSNSEFVELLYTNVLPGNSDQAGRDNFTSALDTGTITRAEAVEAFANSAEFIARTRLDSAAFAENFILDPVDFQVYRLYQAIFDRAPDAGGFAAFTAEINLGNLTLEEAVNGFVDSQEFADTYGSLDNAAFVSTLFGNVLPDNQDTSGQAAFVAALDDESLTRSEVVLALTDSFEFRGQTQDAATAFVQAYNQNLASDELSGGTGDDMLLGLDGVDTFLFEGADVGNDTVMDFTVGIDTLSFSGVPGFDSLADVQAAASQVGADTVIDLGGGNSVTLRNVAVDSLSDANVLFPLAGTSAEAVDAGKADVVAVSEVKTDIVAVAEVLDTLDNVFADDLVLADDFMADGGLPFSVYEALDADALTQGFLVDGSADLL